jgi:hypothetical protein
MQVLRADGQRIDLTSRTVGQRLVAVRQPWQSDAWDYRDMIGELRYSHRLLARSVARVRFYAAELREWPDDPAELTGTDHKLDKQLAADAVANLARLPLDDDPDGFVAALTENLATTGEAWVHGEPDGDGERWTVRSVSEILTSGDRVMLAELPGSSAAGQRPIDPRTEELLRCWIRHPRWGQLADSPLRAMLDVLEEIVLTGREVRAAARSRIAANGILLLPNELSLLRERLEEDDPEDESVVSDTFMADFAAAMTASIRDEGHAQAVVPLVLRGAGEHLKEVRHLTMVRADAETLLARLNGALLRMLHGLDVQPEQVEGMGGLNHWGGWQVEANSVKHQVEPAAAVVAGVLTKAFLRSSLTALDHDPEQVRRIVVHYDITGLVENPNRGQDARDAHERLVITDARLRQDLGYTEDDAPDEEELQRRIAAKTGIDQGTSAIVLELGRALQQAHATRPEPRVIDVDTQPRELPGGSGDGARPAGPGQTVPERRAPAEPDAVTAAAPAADGWRVDVDLARALAGIDAALVERILVAADAAVARAVERAGGRARNAVRRDRVLAASVDGVEPALVAAVIGREQLVAFASVAHLLADSYTRLRGQVRGWLAEARAAVADAVLRMLGVPRRSQQGRAVHEWITGRLAVHEEAALTALTEALDAAAEQALFRADPLGPDPDQRGEHADTIISPAAVARAVAVAGGGRAGQAGEAGMGTGPVVADLLSGEGAVLLGWEWQYRPERLRTPFPAHVELDGTRFATWTDPKLDTDETSAWLGAFFRPGDHAGCLCYAAPIWMVPELDDDLVTRRLAEAARRHADTDRLAEGDTAAGRVGTSAQNEVEVRQRITTAVEQLRRQHIEQEAS